MTTEPLRVRLLNDYQLVVEGLRAMLQPYADRIDVVELDTENTASREVDLTLYDTFGRTQADQGEIDRVIADTSAGSIVVYTWNMHDTLAAKALDKGCRGYLDKSLSADDLVECLERIGTGETVVAQARPGSTDDAETLPGGWPGQREGLSAREAEVIALITQGLTNPEIAARSFITLNSLKSYIRSAYRKMGVERRSQAVRWGIEHGMLPAEDA